MKSISRTCSRLPGVRRAFVVILLVCLVESANCQWYWSLWEALQLLFSRPYLATSGFHPNACSNLKAAYRAKISGQTETIKTLELSICTHIKDYQSYVPLVVLLTGPPGVGKSWTTRVTAQGLYKHNAHQRCKCNPEDAASCPAFMVFSGMNYLASEEEQAFGRLLDKLRRHTQRHPEALIVIEQFDHLSCGLRDRFRDVLDHPSAYDVRLERAIVMLVSNVGTDATLRLSSELKVKQRSADDMIREVKHTVFSAWKSKCVRATEPVEAQQQLIANEKLLKKVNHILPFWLLTKADIRHLFQLLLELENGDRRARLGKSRADKLLLRWDDRLLDFLVSKYDFNSGFAVDGGSRCSDVLRQYVLGRLEDVLCPASATAVELTHSAAHGVRLKCSEPASLPAEL